MMSKFKMERIIRMRWKGLLFEDAIDTGVTIPPSPHAMDTGGIIFYDIFPQSQR